MTISDTSKTSISVHQAFGVFYKGELETVEMTEDHAVNSAKAISVRPNGRGGLIDNIPANRHIKKVFVLETDLVSGFLFGLKEVLNEAIKEFRQAERAEKKMLDDLMEEKQRTGVSGTMPEHYWEPRWKAYLKMEAAKRVVEALEKEATSSFFNVK